MMHSLQNSVCAVAGLQSVANDSEASTKIKEEKLQILLSFQYVAGTISA